jgi:hypothetical protein
MVMCTLFWSEEGGQEHHEHRGGEEHDHASCPKRVKFLHSRFPDAKGAAEGGGAAGLVGDDVEAAHEAEDGR